MTNRYPPRITTLHPQIRPLAFFTHMALATGLVMALPTPVHAQASRHYDIPAGPLDTALNRFALQAGIALVIDAEKLKGLHSPGLRGEYGIDAGFAALLRNTGYNVARTPSGYILVEAPRTVAAPVAGTGETQLPTLVVTDVREPMGTTVIDRKHIETQAAGNGDITSLLKIHPNVQFNNTQLSSKSPGEISPANISINGAKYYQNAFIVDGMNMNNDIDPAQTNPNLADYVPGNSQGMALDTDLLESIVVYDSNVPAAYGRFNGGVIEANTRKPKKEFSGKISYQATKSSWTRYHIDERQKEDFEYAADYWDQPEFDKFIVRGTLEGHLTENFGLLANFSQKRSTIPTSFYSSNNIATNGWVKEEQKREIDNYFIKAVWQPVSRLTLESSLSSAPEENTYYRTNTADGAFTVKNGGTQFNLKALWDGDLAKVEHNLSYGQIEQSRDSEAAQWYTWRKSTSKPWGPLSGSNASSIEGGTGDLDQLQKTWSYRLNADWKAFTLLGATHRVQSGLEISSQYVHWDRPADNSTFIISTAAGNPWTNTCINSSGVVVEACSIGTTVNGEPGQYLNQRTRSAKGKFDFTTTQWAAWVQDEIEIDRLTLRPGVRVDSDNYMDKTTWAPRMAATYDVFANQSTVLTAGANRYYGRNITNWRLSDNINRLKFTERRANLDAPWTPVSQAKDLSKFDQLDIPYDDELMFGISQRWRGAQFDLKYVNRKGRDQIMEVQGQAIGQPSTDPDLSNTYTTWTNGGKSETDIVTLTVTPLQAIEALGTRTTGQLVLDWTKSKKSAPDYLRPNTSEHELHFQNPWIQYDGDIIHYANRPASNYNRPWTLRLSTITEIPQWNLTWSNFLRYRAAYSKIAQTKSATTSGVFHNGQQIAVWEKRKFNNALTWDIRLGWEYPFARNQAVFVNIDVFNVLDKKSVADTSNVTSTGIPTYEVGRQFWLEVGYRF